MVAITLPLSLFFFLTFFDIFDIFEKKKKLSEIQDTTGLSTVDIVKFRSIDLF